MRDQIDQLIEQMTDIMETVYNIVDEQRIEIESLQFQLTHNGQLQEDAVEYQEVIPERFAGLIRHGEPPSQGHSVRHPNALRYPLPFLQVGESFSLKGVNAMERLHGAAASLKKEGRKFTAKSHYNESGERVGATMWRTK